MTAQPARKPALHPTTQYAVDVDEGRIVTGKPVLWACRRHLEDLEHGEKRAGFWFDEEMADRIIRFFGLLKFIEGDRAGERFDLEPWQQFIAGSIFGWMTAECFRRFREAWVRIARGNGKSPFAAGTSLYCTGWDGRYDPDTGEWRGEQRAQNFTAAPLALDTPIATANGWATMGTITTGDQVFDECGRRCTVTGVSEIFHDRDCYAVCFDDGSEIVCDGDHLWRVDSKDLGHSRKGTPRGVSPRYERTLSTREIRKTARTPQGDANHRIPLALPLETADRDLPIPPYTLGAWLGDGRSDGGQIAHGECDRLIMEKIIAEGERVSEFGHDDLLHYTVLGLRGRLVKAGLLRNKHVPDAYLRASKAQRLELVRGLLDTDGCCSKTGEVRFSNRNERIARGLHHLLATLGLAPKIHAVQVTGSPHWVVSTRANGEPLFHLRRKAERQVIPTKRARRRRIVAVRPVESAPVRCIAVDSPSHLFLAGPALIATHNTKLEQARIVLDLAELMRQESEMLSDRLEPIGGTSLRRIIDPQTHSYLRALGRDSKTEDGWNPLLAVFDEVHAYGHRGMWDVMASATVKRKQSLLFGITTAGYGGPLSFGYQQNEHYRRVIDPKSGVTDDRAFVYIAEMVPRARCLKCRGKQRTEDGRECKSCGGRGFLGDDYRDERNWIKANPNLGVSVQIDGLRDLVAKAQIDKKREPDLLVKNFNQDQASGERAISLEDWDATGEARPMPSMDELKQRPCFAGLDLASNQDLNALDLYFPPYWKWKTAALLSFFWVAEDTIPVRRQRDGMDYQPWVDSGALLTTEGRFTDQECISRKLDELAGTFNIRGVAADRKFGEKLLPELEQKGFTVERVAQSFANLCVPWQILERLIGDLELAHGGQVVMRWCAGNVVLKRDPDGLLIPSKEKSAEKIDGVAAGLNAIYLANKTPLGPPPNQTLEHHVLPRGRGSRGSTGKRAIHGVFGTGNKR